MEEEQSGKPAVSRRSKYFTVVKSSYSLRKTSARSDCKPESSSSSSVAADESGVNAASKPLARTCPSLVRVSAVHSSPSGDPKTPTPSNGAVPHELDSRRWRVQKTLEEFRTMYNKVAEEEERAPGARARLGIMAYNMLKGESYDPGRVTRSLGAVRGVEIGDIFKLRIELSLIGLHSQLQANVDYVTRGDKLVATSIVAMCLGNQGKHTEMTGDTLVCGGVGMARFDQKMEGGNLALKNSISEGTPVRVILCFKDGNKIDYVYGGLYTAEKHWSKKVGRRQTNVFLFQLRRLGGEAKLDVEDVMKSISSSAIKNKLDVQLTNCFGKRGREEDKESKAHEAEPQKRVKQTLQEFISIYEKLKKEDEAKQKEAPARKKEPGDRSRFDLDAYNIVKEKMKDWGTKYVGAPPGVEVGDRFHFRAELSLLNLHCQLQADIDYIQQDDKLLAVSIATVRMGRYNNNTSKSDVLLFCGSGLKDRDQKMAKGNLALKNSIEAKTPVRVFNGFKKNKLLTIYVYYGLYLVEKHWKKKNDEGHYEFMFRLRRLPGQPEVDVNAVKRLLSLTSYSGYKYTQDVSRGKEKVPIRVVNTIDDESFMPYKYITEVTYPAESHPAPLEGCNCVNGCSDSDSCACAVRNGGELPFNRKGAIVEAKPLVYECGPSCNCPPSCHNRVSQHGIKLPLEIFKTKTTGWGVRCRTFIPSGTFICEYIGEMLEDEEAQKRATDEYLFAIGNNYYDKTLWEGLSSVPCLQNSASSEDEEDGGFTIDASKYGNIGKFINHSCTPNLYAQNLLYDHDDKRMPHVTFFACEDIPPMQELTYHYNYTIDSVQDSDGNIRKKNCYCGSDECTGRLY